MFFKTPTVAGNGKCWCGSDVPFAACHGTPEQLIQQGNITPGLPVPPEIQRPEYAVTGRPVTTRPANYVESPENIENIRKACHAARRVLKALMPLAQPGITTEMLDQYAHKMIIDEGGYPSPLNYCGYPKSICTSVNEVICHGIPDTRPLRSGDIVNLDITVYLNGVHGDCSATVLVGEVDPVSTRLVRETWEAMRVGIETVRPGVLVSEIGRAIERYMKGKDMSIVRAYCGHGIGTVFHTDLQVAHYYDKAAKTRLRAGMVLTVEPMINMGTWRHRTWSDGWTAVTQDLWRSAQFEHTVLITPDGVEILTLLPDEKFTNPVA